MIDYENSVKEKVLEELKKANLDVPNWHKEILTHDPNIIVWYLKELVDKQEGYTSEILKLAKIYSEYDDPTPETDNLNEKIIKGEEVRNIYTVRGMTCWLLSSIAATFKTEYYPEIISIIEKLALDPVYYIRLQATYPISFFTKNIRAKQHPNGDTFDFKDEHRQKIIDLSFKMLRVNRDIPRVLEGVINIFDGLRFIDNDQAKELIEHLFYNSKGKLQPEYLTQHSIPLLLFFAEYRSENKLDLNDNFNGEWFQNLSKELLKLSVEKAPYLRSTFVWHTWKEIQADSKSYAKLKQYIPYFLHDEFEDQALDQYDFLIKEVMKISPSDGIDLFTKELIYINKWASKYKISDHAWLLFAHEIVAEVAKNSPDDLIKILSLITDIVRQNVYIGYLPEIYSSYKLVPDVKKGLGMHSQISEMYSIAKISQWAKDLPETI